MQQLQLTRSRLRSTAGAGNIGDVGTAVAPRADQDVIPEGAYRTSEQGDHHTGRGGAGNEIHTNGSAAKDGSAPISLADKLKSKVLGIFKK